MRVLVTGNLGYIGSVLTTILEELGRDVVGLDVGFFSECVLGHVTDPLHQITKDVRDVSLSDVQGVDAVVHLAALSNDPLGELAPGITEEINRDATLTLAELAREAGVRRFVYASSQSIYGIAKVDAELDEDDSHKNPITAYARTKWEAELGLKALQSRDFSVACFRPSTVFGASPRLRCDIVYNNLLACAYTTGKIEVKSDGTPWRPVVHVRDVCAAFIAGLDAPAEIVGGRSFNVGIPDGNFSVRQLAEVAQGAVPGCDLVFTGEHGKDARTYRVSFDRILTELKEYYHPSWSLEAGGSELVDLFESVGFTEADFRGRRCNRLAQLRHLQAEGVLDERMRGQD
jgi:nucleoside-diphosphate-sugar epimerase